MNFYKEIKNKKAAYDIVKNTFNINQHRLINLVDVLDGESNHALVLVIYDYFVNGKERMKLNLDIEVFDFNIFEFDYNNKIDIEDVIKRIKK